MTMQIIDTTDPDDLREGDVVTITRGEKGEPGYEEQTRLICAGVPDEGQSRPAVIRTAMTFGYRITEVRREVPDLPDHAGALAFTDDGLLMSDEYGDFCWCDSARWNHEHYSKGDLTNPIAATPVPAKELAEMLKGWRDDATVEAMGHLASKLLYAAFREWARAGVPEPEMTP